jgi:hypothetical protein
MKGNVVDLMRRGLRWVETHGIRQARTEDFVGKSGYPIECSRSGILLPGKDGNRTNPRGPRPV